MQNPKHRLKLLSQGITPFFYPLTPLIWGHTPFLCSLTPTSEALSLPSGGISPTITAFTAEEL